MDDAFRRQLESVQAAHQAELLRLANEKQQKIEEANQKVKCGQLSHKCFFLQSGRKKLCCVSVSWYEKGECRRWFAFSVTVEK